MRSLGTPARRRFGLALAGATAALAFAAPAANADFTLQRCEGGAINGNGASLQNVAQGIFANLFATSEGCPGITVAYNAGGAAVTGSGAGLKAIGATDGVRTGTNNPDNSRFIGSDEPLTPAQQLKVNGGPTDATTDDGKIHTIPVAAAAVTVVVNLPNSCLGTPSPIGAANFDATSGRIQIPNAKIAQAFAAQSGGQTWGQLLPGTSSPCADEPVRRIVRQDVSGTTFAFKSYLNKISPGTFDLANSTTWPSQGDKKATNGANDTPANTCDASICTNTASGGGNLRALLNNTRGGIGYLALADARSGYDKGDALKATPGSDQQYWLQLQNTQGTVKFNDPTDGANGWKTPATGGTKGSNCFVVPAVTPPAGDDPTLGDWSTFDLTGGPGYPACTLTYDMAFDDNAPVWGNSDAEQAKARTVKDYLGLILGAGQTFLLNNDYAPLGTQLKAIAQKGVDAIGWNKSAGGGGGTGTTTTTTQPPVTQPPATQPTVTTPIPTPISNAFSLTSAKVKGTAITTALTLPGAGKVEIKATSKIKGKTVTFATFSKALAGGKGTITLKASAKAKSALKKVKTAKVTLKITFTPNGGTAASKSKTVTVKGTLKTKKKSSKK